MKKIPYSIISVIMILTMLTGILPAVGLQVSVAGKWNDLQNDCTFNSNELNFFSIDKYSFISAIGTRNGNTDIYNTS